MSYTRREFLKYGASVLGGAAVFSGVDAKTRDSINAGTRVLGNKLARTYERVNTLENLSEIIERGEPAEVLFDLGEGRERTELLVTQSDGSSRATNRISSSPRIKLYRGADGELLMDFADSDERADRYSYIGLTPRGAVYESPTCPDNPHDELGDLSIGNVHVSHYKRPEYKRAA